MQTYTILLVEDNEADADYIKLLLKRPAEDARFEVEHVAWLNSAFTAIANRSYDAVLLDLSLPDSQGIDTIVSFMNAAPELPVIVMTGHDDMTAGINAVRYGAQDYLIKGEVTDRPLERAIMYAIERKRSDLVSKRLIQTSISHVTETTAGSATLVKAHLVHITDFISDLRSYVARNAPQALADIEALVAKHDIDVVLREIRTMLAPPRLHRTIPMKRVSERAMEAVKSLGRDTPVPPASAKNVLINVIESSDEISARYASSEDGDDD